MSQLIEITFKKIANDRYITVNRQTAFAIMGGIGFLLMLYAFIDSIIKSQTNISFSMFHLIECVFFFILSGGIMLLFVAMGLFTITTEINLSTRVVRVTRRNFRGQQATQEQPLDDLQLSAAEIGVSDASPKGGWIVRAGFAYLDDEGNESSVAIWSKEVTTIEERNSVLFELYPFFFPNRPPVSEKNIVTNGKVVLLLSLDDIASFLESKLESVATSSVKKEKKMFDNFRL